MKLNFDPRESINKLREKVTKTLFPSHLSYRLNYVLLRTKKLGEGVAEILTNLFEK